MSERVNEIAALIDKAYEDGGYDEMGYRINPDGTGDACIVNDLKHVLSEHSRLTAEFERIKWDNALGTGIIQTLQRCVLQWEMNRFGGRRSPNAEESAVFFAVEWARNHSHRAGKG